MAGAKNQHANKTKGETEVRPEMFNAHCLRVKCRMWVARVGGWGRRRLCTLARGVWAALQHPQWTVATFLFVLFFFPVFCLIFIFGVYISLLTRRVSAKERSGRADGG